MAAATTPSTVIKGAFFRGSVYLGDGHYESVVTIAGEVSFNGAVVAGIKEERMGLEIEMTSGAKFRVPYAQVQSYPVE